MDGATPVLPKMLSTSPPRRSICSTIPVAADARTKGDPLALREAWPSMRAPAEKAGSGLVIVREDAFAAAS